MMGDMGEIFNEMKRANKEKKEKNQQSSTEILIAKEVPFDSKNWGNHLVVTGISGLIDFWPSTGKFIQRSNGNHGRGVRKLLKLCDVKPEDKA